MNEIMCKPTFPTLARKNKQNGLNKTDESLSSRYSAELEIHELRGRLDRRNTLLDVIRKAYHRDILVVKEYLIDAQKQGLVAAAENEDVHSLGSALASVPSIDLRETFRLFAPQECEMRVRPCWSCGGQLEVIHRESARIVNFKHSIHLLEEKEKDLQMELVDVKVKVQKDREFVVDVMEKRKHERDVLMDQIQSLKHQVSDRNALDAEVQQLNECKKNLENTLEKQQPILDDHKRLLVEIEDVKKDREQWKAKFHEKVEQNSQLQNEKEELIRRQNLLQQENKQLQSDLQETRDQCQNSEEQCSALSHDLSKSRASTKEVEACLHKAEQAIDELEAESQKEKQEMEIQLNELKSKCSHLQDTVVDLESTIVSNSEEMGYYRKKIKATLEGARRRGSIACVPQNREAAFETTDELIRETQTLRNKTAILFNLLLSCIRSTYENCLVQEKLLADNGSELHKNNRKLATSSEPTNEKARLVLKHLENSDESDILHWTTILQDDTDQRHVLGNLQNRLQMGQFSLDKAFQKIYKAHEIELRRCREEHQKQIEERRSRIFELEKMLTEAISLNRKYEGTIMRMTEKYDCVEPMFDSIRQSLRKTRRECLDNNAIVIKLKGDFEKLKATANRLLDELKAAKETVQAKEQTLNEKRQDINNRDAAIEQLEKLLEKITHKYAENERLRIKVTHEAEVQAVPAVRDALSHADFLPTPLRGIAAADSENQKPALLQGRIFNISSDENWLSRINTRRPMKGIQFRKAIDKL